MTDTSEDSNSDSSIAGALSPSRLFGDDEGESENEQTRDIKERLQEQGVDPNKAFFEDIELDTDEEEVKEEVSEEEVKEELISDYIDFDWSSQLSGAKQKINEAANGDKQAYADVYAAPRRVKDYFLYHRIPRDTILDILLPLTLAIYGLGILIAGVIIGGVTLTGISRLADLFLADAVVLLIASGLFVYLRKQSDLSDISSVDIVRRRLRSILLFLHMIPTLAVAWLVYAGFQDGQSSIDQGIIWFVKTLVYWDNTLPTEITSIGSFIWQNTPIGITTRQTAAIMLIAGVISTIPFVLAMAKVLLIAINVGLREEVEEETDGERDLLEAVQGVGELSHKRGDGPVTKESLPEGSYDPDMPKTVEEVDDQKSLDLLGSAKSQLTSYEEPDDLLETHDAYKVEEYDGYVEIDRYWLKEPYSYATILRNDEEDDLRYFAVEPQLDPIENEIYREIRDRLETALRSESVNDEYEQDMVDEKKMEILEERALEIAVEYNLELSDLSLQKILYRIERDYIGYKEIDVLMNDINAEDISCVGPDRPIWINHSKYENIATNIKFERKPLRRFISQLAQRSGEQISAADPMQDATLPDGSRAQLSLGEDITTKGSTFTIRQFQDIPFTPIDLIRTKTFNLEQMAYLWLAIQNNQSLIFAGGTASGKTTSMNAMSLFIPPKAKVVTLEDTREITLPHKLWIPGKTREGTSQEEDAGDEISMYNLLESALRQRPEYLVVGEVRGEEAQSLFQAMSTGHTTYSTMHADSVSEAVNRLENDPINVPQKMVDNLDIICIQRRLIYKGEVERRNINITEIGPSENGHTINKVFDRDPETDDWIYNQRESEVLKFIREENVWTPEYLRDELERRKKVLKYLIDKEVVKFESVTKVIQKYMNEDDKEKFINKIDNETLEPEEIEDIADLDLENIGDKVEKDKTEQILGN